VYCLTAESVCSNSSQSSERSESSATTGPTTTSGSKSQQQQQSNYQGMDFQLIVENKSGNGPGKVVHLVAPSMQDKAAWISDISQVNIFTFVQTGHYNGLLSSYSSSSSCSVSTMCILTTLCTAPFRMPLPSRTRTRCATIHDSSTTTLTSDSAALSTRAKSSL